MKKILVKRNEEVCAMKSLFDFLQMRELKFLPPIEVTSLVDVESLFHGKSKKPKIYLWNQISDPDLGVNDFLKVEGAHIAKFKWVVVDGEILSIKDFSEKGRDFSEIQLFDIMNKLDESGKFPVYFVAEGLYEGVYGLHFCLTPFNDVTSCKVLEKLFGCELAEKFKNLEQDENFVGSDLNSYFNPDSLDECHQIFVNHFKKSLGLVPVPV